MTLNRFDDPKIYPYDKPVVVLMNGKCFSACDIFLAGLKGLKNVTLLGTPSGGGSALTQGIRLPELELEVRLASMASFQSDGNLFDGHGVHPDILVNAGPHYHIGGPDKALESAVTHIGEVRGQ
jgi:C-terminal processing protease CtpA/Prc